MDLKSGSAHEYGVSPFPRFRLPDPEFVRLIGPESRASPSPSVSALAPYTSNLRSHEHEGFQPRRGFYRVNLPTPIRHNRVVAENTHVRLSPIESVPAVEEQRRSARQDDRRQNGSLCARFASRFNLAVWRLTEYRTPRLVSSPSRPRCQQTGGERMSILYVVALFCVGVQGTYKINMYSNVVVSRTNCICLQPYTSSQMNPEYVLRTIARPMRVPLKPHTHYPPLASRHTLSP